MAVWQEKLQLAHWLIWSYSQLLAALTLERQGPAGGKARLSESQGEAFEQLRQLDEFDWDCLIKERDGG